MAGVKRLDREENKLRFPESKYDNLRSGVMPAKACQDNPPQGIIVPEAGRSR
jgi:hypothetical protein